VISTSHSPSYVVSGFSRTDQTRRVLLVVLCLLIFGCGRSPETPAPPSDTQQPAVSTGVVNVQFQSQPDPPRSGPNTIEVTVRQPDGSPVTDASVTAVFSMPPMPAMNMPAMRSEAPLTHAGNGVYRGTGQLSMSGTWNVAVRVSRGAEQLATKQLSIIAK
jgi:YtkA-like protein